MRWWQCRALHPAHYTTAPVLLRPQPPPVRLHACLNGCRRTLCGRPVTSYDQFCEYLAAKDPGRIRVATLPFEGRNRVLYRLAP